MAKSTPDQPNSTLRSISDCRVGMTIRHISPSSKSGGAGIGKIIGIGRDGVLVEFEAGFRGLYDDRWFDHADAWLSPQSDPAAPEE